VIGSTIRPAPAAGETAKALLLLALMALVTRVWVFGNPVTNIDEEFYLLVGERMRDDLLPYVDIWDRKPIGLFLIYAAADAVFRDPVIGHQLLASLCAFLTGWLIFACARRRAGFAASLAGGLAYIAWLPVFAGIGGQSPVFYNLPMMAGAAMVLGLIDADVPQRIFARGCAVMLLAGIALQIKYSAVFDGIFFGLTLLWLGWRSGWSFARLAGSALGWIACALMPTGAALAAYAAMGHADAFIQANFLSIFDDINSPLNAVLRLGGLTFGLAPFLVCLAIVWKRRETLAVGEWWCIFWFAASYLGFLAFGVYYDHYVLPLLLPLCLIAAMAFARVKRWKVAIALVVGLGLLGGQARALADRMLQGSGDQARALAAKISPHLHGGCLYVNEAVPALYRLTNSCLPTRFAFPEHLVIYRYEHALGVNQLGEIDRIFASRPTVVLKSLRPDDDTRAASRALLERHLSEAYRKVDEGEIGETRFEVYALRQAEPTG
jgi:hypothetical protein